MGRRERVASAGNTEVPAILTLRSLGFEVRCESSSAGDQWWAVSQDLEFVGEDPLTLLGLASMRQTRGPDWTATDEEIDGAIREFGWDNDAV